MSSIDLQKSARDIQRARDPTKYTWFNIGYIMADAKNAPPEFVLLGLLINNSCYNGSFSRVPRASKSLHCLHWPCWVRKDTDSKASCASATRQPLGIVEQARRR